MGELNYVYLPKDVTQAYREHARVKAAKKTTYKKR